MGKTLDPAIWGHFRWGYFRWGVYNPVFERMVERLRQTGKLSTIIWLKRVEGARDPDTGQPTLTWEEEEISVIIIQPERISPLELEAGMSREEFMRVYTVEPVRHLDRIKFPRHGRPDRFGFVDTVAEYEIQPPQERFNGDDFVYRVFSIKRLEEKWL